MRITILGAGPAGLYLGYLLRRKRPDLNVTVVERNDACSTFGFGVVFSRRALDFLKEDDAETHDAIVPHMETWSDTIISHRNENVRIDGIGFAAIGRLKLLQILQARARAVGLEPRYNTIVENPEALLDCDLLVAADGANSLIRDRWSRQFGTSLSYLTNRFAWFGANRAYPELTQSFVQTGTGHFTAHHYRYAPDMSTFLIEVDAETFDRNRLASLSEVESQAFCEGVFKEQLGGGCLSVNRSHWRQFPIVRNERWFYNNVVLVGDALRTAHFSIGSGTRLAMEDAIALSNALETTGYDVQSALLEYESRRRPVVEKLVSAANASAAWYEKFSKYMELNPRDLAMSYVTRSGRVDLNRLREIAPNFVRKYEGGMRDDARMKM